MALKLCKNCDFHTKQVIQTPQGYINMDLCTNEDCRDVISGDPIPCAAARQQQVFCGFEGRYFKKDEKEVKETPLISLVSKT